MDGIISIAAPAPAPKRKKAAPAAPPVPAVLTLQKFSGGTPHMDFGSVVLGTSAERTLRVVNPSSAQVRAVVLVQKISLSGTGRPGTSFATPPRSSAA